MRSVATRSVHSVNQDLEAAWDHFGTLSGRTRRRSWRYFEFGRRQVDVVSLWVERHRPRAAFGREGLHDGQLVGRVFAGDRYIPFPVRAEGESGPGIK